jgi:hypothetical protein
MSSKTVPIPIPQPIPPIMSIMVIIQPGFGAPDSPSVFAAKCS